MWAEAEQGVLQDREPLTQPRARGQRKGGLCAALSSREPVQAKQAGLSSSG